jgi:hypothetical protein
VVWFDKTKLYITILCIRKHVLDWVNTGKLHMFCVFWLIVYRLVSSMICKTDNNCTKYLSNQYPVTTEYILLDMFTFKSKSPLSLKCILISCTLSFNWHLNLIKVCATLSCISHSMTETFLRGPYNVIYIHIIPGMR